MVDHSNSLQIFEELEYGVMNAETSNVEDNHLVGYWIVVIYAFNLVTGSTIGCNIRFFFQDNYFQLVACRRYCQSGFRICKYLFNYKFDRENELGGHWVNNRFGTDIFIKQTTKNGSKRTTSCISWTYHVH